MVRTLRDGKTPTMTEVRKSFPGVGEPWTLGSESVKQVRKLVREMTRKKGK